MPTPNSPRLSRAATNRFVDYDAFRDETVPGRSRQKNPMGGYFSPKHCTMLGKEALRLAKDTVGILPHYRGASKEGVYFKYRLGTGPVGTLPASVVLTSSAAENLLALRDRLLDLGVEVELEVREHKGAQVFYIFRLR
jgi:hypothetical protein